MSLEYYKYADNAPDLYAHSYHHAQTVVVASPCLGQPDECPRDWILSFDAFVN